MVDRVRNLFPQAIPVAGATEKATADEPSRRPGPKLNSTPRGVDASGPAPRILRTALLGGPSVTRPTPVARKAGVTEASAVHALPNGREIATAKSQLTRIAAGQESLYYYSAIGSSYGDDTLTHLEHLLNDGARLSARGNRLLGQIRELVGPEIDRPTIAATIVEHFLPENANSERIRQVVAERLRSKPAAALFMSELRAVLHDIAVFKKNAADVHRMFRDVYDYFRLHRDDEEARCALHQLKRVKHRPALRAYADAFTKLYRERWNESFEPASPQQLREWAHALSAARESQDYRGLSHYARNLLDMQLKREAAGRFHDNYGGLFNRRDPIFTWYAAGPSGMSRESFESIQSFFAKDGITFEFRPRVSDHIYRREILQPARRDENDGLPRDGITYDTISTAGNRLPEDVTRVYCANPALLSRVQQMFEAKLGEATIRELGIEFRNTSEQPEMYRQDIDAILSGHLGSESAPKVSARVVGNRAFFLSDEEMSEIANGSRPLHTRLALAPGSAVKGLLDLIERHAQVAMDIEPVEMTVARRGSKPQPGGIIVELRPEVAPAQAQDLARAKCTELDLRQISRIYFTRAADRSKVESALDRCFGEHTLHRWSLSLHDATELETVSQQETKDLLANEPHERRPALLQPPGGRLDVASSKTVRLEKEEVRLAVRDMLLGSENYGFRRGIDMRTVLSREDYETWFRLQELTVGHARKRSPLTRKLIEQFSAAASGQLGFSKDRDYRINAERDQETPGGTDLGSRRSIEVQQAQHLFQEPFFELPKEVYRTSPTSLAVDYLNYAEPGSSIVDTLDRLVRAYNDSTLPPAHRAALLFKDLMSLHAFKRANDLTARAVLAYLLLKEGLPPPVFGRAASSAVFLRGQEYLDFVSAAIDRSRATLASKVTRTEGTRRG